MEEMPDVETGMTTSAGSSLLTIEPAVVSSDWQQRLPVLSAPGVTLRELTLEDAAPLCALLTTEEVSRFISPPPTTVTGFEKFIRWTHQQRTAGRYFCFGVVPRGMTTAVGLFQVRALESDHTISEWGFVIGQAYWGTGLFTSGAQLVLDFVFTTLGVERLEARSSVENGRGNGALRKTGAVFERVLERAFLRHERLHDQNLWSIHREAWLERRSAGADVASVCRVH
jgi:ribosomal-protein-alanine N-acetyltransferase